MVEHATHIRSVRGSNPCTATIPILFLTLDLSQEWPSGQKFLVIRDLKFVDGPAFLGTLSGRRN